MASTHLYAALLDVLGYRQHLEMDRGTGRLDFQEKLGAALQILESIDEGVFHVQAISDTIIVTCSDHQHFVEFLILLRKVFLAFLGQGLYVRGGIAYSRHYQKKHLTYSHAVAKAYELESSHAIYPRIVIDGNIIKMYETGSDLASLTSTGLICVENGVHFLNILTSDNWADVHAKAKLLYESNREVLLKDESAFSKHIRFERYLLYSSYAPESAASYIGKIVDK